MLNEYFLPFRVSSFSLACPLASSGLMASPTRSCDRLDDDHMTAVGHRRRGSSYRNQGYELHPIYDDLLLSCDRRQGGHMTSED